MLLLLIISIVILFVAALIVRTPSFFLFDLIDSTFSDGA